MLTGAHESVAGGLDLAIGRAKADGCAALRIFTKNSNQWREPEPPPKRSRPSARLTPRPVAFRSSRTRATSSTSAPTTMTSSRAPETRWSRRSSAAAVSASRSRCSTLAPTSARARRRASRESSSRWRTCCRALTDRARASSSRTRPARGRASGAASSRLRGIFEGLPAGAVDARMGVCFDTQHAFASGYDLATDAGYDETFGRFDSLIGLGHIRAFHLNTPRSRSARASTATSTWAKGTSGSRRSGASSTIHASRMSPVCSRPSPGRWSTRTRKRSPSSGASSARPAPSRSPSAQPRALAHTCRQGGKPAKSKRK